MIIPLIRDYKRGKRVSRKGLENFWGLRYKEKNTGEILGD